jgi:hypothetical protein
MGDRDIASLARLDGQGNADQFGTHGVEGRGFRIDG